VPLVLWLAVAWAPVAVLVGLLSGRLLRRASSLPETEVGNVVDSAQRPSSRRSVVFAGNAVES